MTRSILKAGDKLRRIRVTAAAAMAAVLLISGCGPQFNEVRGTLNSDGGQLHSWSASPAICSRGDTTGEPEKLLILSFGLPKGFEATHPGNRNAPRELVIARNGSGYMGSLKMMASVKEEGKPFGMDSLDGFVLDGSTCRTITRDRQEQSATMGSSQKPVKGHLVLDCTVKASHVTADMSFKNCSF